MAELLQLPTPAVDYGQYISLRKGANINNYFTKIMFNQILLIICKQKTIPSICYSIMLILFIWAIHKLYDK